MKILHIATDEKFIDSANFQFEDLLPAQNEFILFVEDVHQQLRFVKQTKNIKLLPYGKASRKEVGDMLANYDLVVLHSLDVNKALITLSAPKNVKFVWLFWGAEIYNNPLIKFASLYGQYTNSKFNQSSVSDLFEKVKLRGKRLAKGILQSDEKLVLNAAKRIDVFAALIEEEYDLFKKNGIISKQCQFHKFTYYPLDFLFRNKENNMVNSANILLGNSASKENNHLEIFNMLPSPLDGSLVVPLSYGDRQYAEYIVKEGKKKFGLAFDPLIDFLPLNEYNKRLQSCGIVIMNHYRQQAIGNIITSLWLGAKVFLSKKNLAYDYFKRIGIIIFTVEDDLNDEKMSCLTANQIEGNRKALIDEMNKIELEKLIN